MNTISRALITVVFICLTLAGCASTQRQLMAGTRMKLRSYAHSNVGILPLSVNPVYASSSLDLEEIRKAVHDELVGKTPVNAHIITSEEIASLPANIPVEFPLTPRRIAIIGESLKLDAIIGINILAWSPPVGVHRARISLVISFADVGDRSRKWVLSSTWKSQTVAKLPDTLRQELGTQFNALNRWLKSGLIPFTSEHGSPEEPIVTFFSPAGNTPLTERSTSDKTLDIVLTAIDDDGIASLTVENPAVPGYSWQPPQTSTPQLPVFLSAPLTIPLAPGSNPIRVVATDKDGAVTTRPIALRSTSRRGLHLLALGIGEYPDLPYARGAPEAIDKFSADRRSMFVSEPELLFDKDAKPSRVQEALHRTQSSLGLGDEMLIVLAGRGGVTRDDPYLALYGTRSATPGSNESEQGVPRELHLSDLAALASERPTLIVIDLCTDADYLEDGRAALGRALDAIQRSGTVSRLRVATQLSDCRKSTFGKLIESASSKLREARKAQSKTESLFASLRNEPGLIAVAQAPSPFKFAPGGAPRFWAVASSSASMEEAKDVSRKLQSQGYDSEVVLGINGVFSATLGSVDSVTKAKELIRSAQQRGQITDPGYVLDGEKIKQRVPQ